MNTKGSYGKSIFNRWFLLLVFEKRNPERFAEMKKDETLVRYMDFLEGMIRGVLDDSLKMETGFGKITLTLRKKKRAEGGLDCK
jgi:hypothetical protein